jgi:tetratricopeptide (TPR) repeat protein
VPQKQRGRKGRLACLLSRPRIRPACSPTSGRWRRWPQNIPTTTKEIYEDTLKADPECAIAYWGIALSLLNNPHGSVPAPNLAPGLAAIAGQLIDAETGAHLWAERFDGALEDMFDLQDHVTSSVVGTIAPKLRFEEILRARGKPTENLDAYDYYLRGLLKVRRLTMEANREALQLFHKAIELDPGLACAYGGAAWCYTLRKVRGWMIDHVQESAEATRLARKAVQLGGDDPAALCMGGYALAFIAREFDDAAAFIDRGLAVNPNDAQAWTLSGWLRVWRGEPDLALEHVAHAMRLSPLDPSMYGMQGAMAYAHFLAGRYDMASSCAEKSMRDHPTFLLAICISATSNALAGRLEPAQKAMTRALECYPNLRVSNLRDLALFLRAEDLATFAKGLRKAGLPE